MNAKLILMHLAVVMMAAGSVSLLAATRTVDRLDDTASGSSGITACTAAPNDCDLRGAISGAGNGGLINFDPALNGHTITINGGIDVDLFNLNIQGPGAGLLAISDPTTNAYVFTMGSFGNGTTVSGLTIANSSGGIDVEGSSITLDSLVLSGIQQRSANLFQSAVQVGGQATINNCTFSNNSSYAGDFNNNGPALALLNSAAVATVNSSVFTGNSASKWGGAIYNQGTLQINDSQITNNTAQIDGGAIFDVDSGHVTLLRSTLAGNRSTFDNGGAIAGIHFSGNQGKITVRDSFLGNNTANFGGAIVGGQSLTVINTTFSGNHANNDGGAIYAPSGAGPVVYLRHLTAVGNSANGQGGGIFSASVSASLANSIVTGNTASTTPDTNISGSNNIVGGNAGLGTLDFYGGGTKTYPLLCGSPAINAGSNALSVDDTSAAITEDQRGFARNAAGTVDIGAVEMATASVANISDDVSTPGSLRFAVANANSGDEICFDAAFFSTPQTISMSGSAMTVDKPLLINGPGQNLLTLDAGAASRHFYVTQFGGPLLLSGMTLTNGQANGSNPPGFPYGGSIYVDGFTSNGSGGVLNLQHVTISNSTAILGGGIYNLGTVNLVDSILWGNSAPQGSGGGIYSETFKTLTALRSTFISNTARFGGAMQTIGTSTITDSTFTSNVATEPPNTSSPPQGGAIRNIGTTTVTGSTFTGNTAQWGGAIYNFYYIGLTNNTFTGNQAVQTNNGDGSVDGGALYAGGNYDGNIAGTIDSTNNTVVGNSSAGRGGGIFLLQGATNGYINTSHSIWAKNTAPSGSGPDVYGGMFSYGYNIIGNNNSQSFFPNSPVPTGNQVGTPANPIDPRLAPLGNYGGATQTMAELSNSPSLNTGNPNAALATDQRGQVRPRESVGDIGSYERSVMIDQSTLPPAHRTIAYNQQLSATRETSFVGLAPQAVNNWSVVTVPGESLPPGITLSSGGLLSGTPTTQGTFNFTVEATDGDGIAGVQKLSLNVLAPTAAEVMLAGRVLTPFGNGVRGARVTLTLPDGSTRTVLSNSFGYYSIDGIEAGSVLVVGVQMRGYRFSPQVVTLADSLTDYDLVVSR